MGTRCIIGMETPEGVRYTTCNHGGYLSDVGYMLLHAWKEADVVRLLDEGAVHSLGSEFGVQHDGRMFPYDPGNETSTIFLHRDRKQPYADTRAKTVPLSDFLAFSYDYSYLLRDGEWYTQRPDLVRLADVISALPIVIEFREKKDDCYYLKVEFVENVQPWNETTGTVGSLVEYVQSVAGDNWRWEVDKRRDPAIVIFDDAAMVALKLRFNFDMEDDDDAV